MILEQTFLHFLLDHQNKNNRSFNFVILMESIITAARCIQSRYLTGAVTNDLENTNQQNSHGETQTKFDHIAQEILLHYLKQSEQVVEAISEESEQPIRLNETGRYLVYFDPLDGSANVQSSMPVGIMFGIAKRNLVGPEDFHLRSGKEFIAAGMFIIPAGLFVFALRGSGAWRFLFDSAGNVLRPEKLVLPETPKSWELSWNASYTKAFSAPVTNWLEQESDNYSFRYAGSFAVDFHRLLHKGGLFLYPKLLNFKDPKRNKPEGKLRLIYECAVAAFIAEQAGGTAIDENGTPITEIIPQKLHQRSSILIGNKSLIESYLLSAGLKAR
jgi:fructose-1,6-bisphosphatase I